MYLIEILQNFSFNLFSFLFFSTFTPHMTTAPFLTNEVITTSIDYFNQYHLKFISPFDFVDHLHQSFPFNTLDNFGISQPFFHYLVAHNYLDLDQDDNNVHWMDTLALEFDTLREAATQFTFLVFNTARRSSQKVNHHIFLFNLLLRWNGLSIGGRMLLKSTGIHLPKSTFYSKLNKLTVHQLNYKSKNGKIDV